MLYRVFKTFGWANSKNKAMTASVYGHNFAVKFYRSELEIFCYVYKLHRFVLFFCFAHKLQNANWFFYFSSEAEHFLALFLFLGKSSLSVLIKCVLIRKRRSVLKKFSFA